MFRSPLNTGDRAIQRLSTYAHWLSRHTRAVTLLKYHRSSVIYKALRVNSTTLKQWAAQKHKASTTTFVSLPDEPPKLVAKQLIEMVRLQVEWHG